MMFLSLKENILFVHTILYNLENILSGRNDMSLNSVMETVLDQTVLRQNILAQKFSLFWLRFLTDHFEYSPCSGCGGRHSAAGPGVEMVQVRRAQF
jgi:hypothetical protein